ncbi:MULTISPECIES: DUF6510 family protein [unclassified Streptomyces]|uniref:DUF6510 family protein n=1 Tax=unclassified Streptomyces TaxID=2593676 RepID=UPI0013715979|nr:MULTISPECIES: DUF6510 family protein [unclassified Streptomyces]MYV55248.1 hypothetical protein [Streptomyces sp. SID3212]WSJ41640.1 DUF6510 family protein [Streptomyces sp. NBC_01317]
MRPTQAAGTTTGEAFQDGNVLAGPFREFFTTDLTTATGTCAACGRAGPLAELRVYTHAPGMVARCPECDAVVMRMVRGPEAAWLDMRGTTALRIPLPGE